MGEGRDIAYHFIVKSPLHITYIFIVIWPIFVVVLLSEKYRKGHFWGKFFAEWLGNYVWCYCLLIYKWILGSLCGLKKQIWVSLNFRRYTEMIMHMASEASISARVSTPSESSRPKIWSTNLPQTLNSLYRYCTNYQALPEIYYPCSGPHSVPYIP